MDTLENDTLPTNIHTPRSVPSAIHAMHLDSRLSTASGQKVLEDTRAKEALTV